MSTTNGIEATHPVRVQRHRVDWEANNFDLSNLTGERINRQAGEIVTGCWYFNPRYTVSSPTPTVEFFQKVISTRSTWLRTCRQVQGKSGQRHLARRTEQRGRLSSLLPNTPGSGDEVHADWRGTPLSLSGLSPTVKRDIAEAGHLAKGLGYAGVLFIDGQLIPPRVWQAKADHLSSRPQQTNRNRDVSGL